MAGAGLASAPPESKSGEVKQKRKNKGELGYLSIVTEPITA